MRRTLLLLLLSMLSVGAAAAQLRFEPAARIVVTADVHGGLAEYLSILRETGIVDAAGHWQGGRAQLVSTGDLEDRGSGGRDVIELLMRLEGEARQAGGAVLVILGNHEVMNLVGDLRYVSKEDYARFDGADDKRLRDETWQRVLAQEPAAARAEFDAAYPPGYFARAQAFSPEGHIGKWLLDRAFLITVGDTAFVHGGLPPLVAELGLDGTNARLRGQLDDYFKTWAALRDELKIVRPVEFLDRPAVLARAGGAEQAKKLDALQAQALFGEEGPTWYRGQALCYPYTESDNLQAALTKLGAARVIVGHTVTPTHEVLSRFDGRVIQLDTGMLRSAYQGNAAAYVLENGQWRAAYADRPGQRVPAATAPRAVGTRPGGLDDDALEHWLADAEVVRVEALDTGITKPRRITLRKDGLEMRAVFKDLSEDSGAVGSQRREDISDRFEYDIAAYKLDRLLGLDMVPVAVERTVEGKRGALQLWVEESMNLSRMVKDKKSPSGACAAGPQYNLMNVFDVLTYNTDRNQQNGLFTKDWMLVLIDHTRAFRTFENNPPLLYKGKVVVPAALAERLRTLTPELLQQQLGRYIDRLQISTLLKRRDRLLKEAAAPVKKAA